jgi:hypothetical protein
MKKYGMRERISMDLKVLLEKGRSMNTNQPDFKIEYESWYTECCRVLTYLVPERLDDFKGLYRAHDRKAISEITYSICDFIIGYQFPPSIAGNRLINHNLPTLVANKFQQQVSILLSCEKALTSTLYDIRSLLQAELFDNEVEVAIELYEKGFLRAAGAVLGVVLEQRLASICHEKSIIIQKKEPTINDFNEALKNGNIFSIDQWRFVGHLADIRNICCHNKGSEPTEQKLKDLIDGTKRLLTEMF